MSGEAAAAVDPEEDPRLFTSSFRSVHFFDESGEEEAVNANKEGTSSLHRAADDYDNDMATVLAGLKREEEVLTAVPPVGRCSRGGIVHADKVANGNGIVSPASDTVVLTATTTATTTTPVKSRPRSVSLRSNYSVASCTGNGVMINLQQQQKGSLSLTSVPTGGATSPSSAVMMMNGNRSTTSSTVMFPLHPSTASTTKLQGSSSEKEPMIDAATRLREAGRRKRGKTISERSLHQSILDLELAIQRDDEEMFRKIEGRLAGGGTVRNHSAATTTGRSPSKEQSSLCDGRHPQSAADEKTTSSSSLNTSFLLKRVPGVAPHPLSEALMMSNNTLVGPRGDATTTGEAIGEEGDKDVGTLSGGQNDEKKRTQPLRLTSKRYFDASDRAPRMIPSSSYSPPRRTGTPPVGRPSRSDNSVGLRGKRSSTTADQRCGNLSLSSVSPSKKASSSLVGGCGGNRSSSSSSSSSSGSKRRTSKQQEFYPSHGTPRGTHSTAEDALSPLSGGRRRSSSYRLGTALEAGAVLKSMRGLMTRPSDEGGTGNGDHDGGGGGRTTGPTSSFLLSMSPQAVYQLDAAYDAHAMSTIAAAPASSYSMVQKEEDRREEEQEEDKDASARRQRSTSRGRSGLTRTTGERWGGGGASKRVSVMHHVTNNIGNGDAVHCPRGGGGSLVSDITKIMMPAALSKHRLWREQCAPLISCKYDDTTADGDLAHGQISGGADDEEGVVDDTFFYRKLVVYRKKEEEEKEDRKKRKDDEVEASEERMCLMSATATTLVESDQFRSIPNSGGAVEPLMHEEEEQDGRSLLGGGAGGEPHYVLPTHDDVLSPRDSSNSYNGVTNHEGGDGQEGQDENEEKEEEDVLIGCGCARHHDDDDEGVVHGAHHNEKNHRERRRLWIRPDGDDDADRNDAVREQKERRKSIDHHCEDVSSRPINSRYEVSPGVIYKNPGRVTTVDAASRKEEEEEDHVIISEYQNRSEGNSNSLPLLSVVDSAGQSDSSPLSTVLKETVELTAMMFQCSKAAARAHLHRIGKQRKPEAAERVDSDRETMDDQQKVPNKQHPRRVASDHDERRDQDESLSFVEGVLLTPKFVLFS